MSDRFERRGPLLPPRPQPHRLGARATPGLDLDALHARLTRGAVAGVRGVVRDGDELSVVLDLPPDDVRLGPALRAIRRLAAGQDGLMLDELAP